MDMQFLEETKMLNYQSVGIQKLINEKRWGELSEYEKIKAIYGFVQNEIPLGYNRNDTLTAEQVYMALKYQKIFSMEQPQVSLRHLHQIKLYILGQKFIIKVNGLLQKELLQTINILKLLKPNTLMFKANL